MLRHTKDISNYTETYHKEYCLLDVDSITIKHSQGSYIFRISNIQGFPGLFYHFFQGFSRALEAPNENNIHN